MLIGASTVTSFFMNPRRVPRTTSLYSMLPEIAAAARVSMPRPATEGGRSWGSSKENGTSTTCPPPGDGSVEPGSQVSEACCLRKDVCSTRAACPACWGVANIAPKIALCARSQI
jgi:hypothetical protein